MDHLFDATVKLVGGAMVVRLRGEIDLAGRERLADCLLTTTGAVVVDLSKVTFLDSSGLSVLADTDRLLDEAGGSMVVRNPTPSVRRTLEITGLDQWIEAPEPLGRGR